MSGSAAVRLRPDAALTLRGQACLALRPFRAGCDACATACPVQVLLAGEGAVRLSPGCLSCGRCAAACPTGALGVSGFVKAPAPRAVTIECARVPDKARRPGALTVVCTGGLSAGHLLRLQAKAGVTGLAVLDRGWCADCPAGGGEFHPAAAALAEAAAIAAACGAPGRPRLESAPLPTRQARPLATKVEETVSAGRRGLFGRALGLEDAAPPPRHDLRAPLEAPERARRLDAARALAAAGGEGALPARLAPVLRVSAACDDHRICTHVCPTSALTAREDGALTFSAAACIACGRCAAICPGGAITVAASGGQFTPAPEVLRHSAARACAACGDDYQDDPDGTPEGLCPTCRKDKGLMRDAWGIGMVSQPREFAE